MVKMVKIWRKLSLKLSLKQILGAKVVIEALTVAEEVEVGEALLGAVEAVMFRL